MFWILDQFLLKLFQIIKQAWSRSVLVLVHLATMLLRQLLTFEMIMFQSQDVQLFAISSLCFCNRLSKSKSFDNFFKILVDLTIILDSLFSLKVSFHLQFEGLFSSFHLIGIRLLSFAPFAINSFQCALMAPWARFRG